MPLLPYHDKQLEALELGVMERASHPSYMQTQNQQSTPASTALWEAFSQPAPAPGLASASEPAPGTEVPREQGRGLPPTSTPTPTSTPAYTTLLPYQGKQREAAELAAMTRAGGEGGASIRGQIKPSPGSGPGSSSESSPSFDAFNDQNARENAFWEAKLGLAQGRGMVPGQGLAPGQGQGLAQGQGQELAQGSGLAPTGGTVIQSIEQVQYPVLAKQQQQQQQQQQQSVPTTTLPRQQLQLFSQPSSQPPPSQPSKLPPTPTPTPAPPLLVTSLAQPVSSGDTRLTPVSQQGVQPGMMVTLGDPSGPPHQYECRQVTPLPPLMMYTPYPTPPPRFFHILRFISNYTSLCNSNTVIICFFCSKIPLSFVI